MFRDLKFKFWLSGRLLFNKQILFGGSAPLSFLGLVLGVAALVASMSVMRGFESSLKQAMIDVTSDIQIIKKGKLIESWDEFSAEIQKIDPSIQKIAKFAYTEAVIASKGKVSGVLIQGFDFEQVGEILNLNSRVREGSLNSAPGTVAIGQGLAKRYSLKLGDEVYLAVSLATPFEDDNFKRQAQAFKIAAILDFGKNDWNERLVLSQLPDFQGLTQIGDRYTGAFVKIADSEKAPELSHKIENELGSRYAVLNWYEVNKNLFKAVKYESVVIFFVVFLIVVVAAFNISSTLYVLIRQRYQDIAILKALGSTQRNIQIIFVMQGLFVACLGCLCGFFVGYLLSQGFMFLQSQYTLISGSVYKIDRIDIRLSWIDFFFIFIATTTACLLATYPPARKGSRLTVVEGLRED
ncbi:FtsX-like permease family protein [Pseudobdellovibrio sp. HCB154]|uniref:FtsX-like permease family protein n=1 Tax=Pseudobdellovibrio sp. HCB154 TaxID=3386277 RepID=UPI003916D372